MSNRFATTRSGVGRAELALLGLAVCLPVPAFAASGLALPLPAAVYRLAADLVSGAQAVAGLLSGRVDPRPAAAAELPRGVIRLASGEAALAVHPIARAAPATRARPPYRVHSKRPHAPQPAAPHAPPAVQESSTPRLHVSVAKAPAPEARSPVIPAKPRAAGHDSASGAGSRASPGQGQVSVAVPPDPAPPAPPVGGSPAGDVVPAVVAAVTTTAGSAAAAATQALATAVPTTPAPPVPTPAPPVPTPAPPPPPVAPPSVCKSNVGAALGNAYGHCK